MGHLTLFADTDLNGPAGAGPYVCVGLKTSKTQIKITIKTV